MVNGRGLRTYFSATAVAMACALARFTLLARFLGPEQLGLASVLILTSQFFDSISDTGADRFLIQDVHGDAEDVQKLVQLWLVIRGMLTACALVLVARPIAIFYDAPPLALASMFMAIGPLISGFMHLDLRRVQRRSDFRTEGVVVLAAEICSLTAIVAAAYVTHSFTAVVYGFIVRALVMVIGSHIRAERPYRLGYVNTYVRRLARFSGPLVFNGLVLFWGQQGDRLIVGKMLGLTELGKYSAILLLIYYPSAMIMRNIQGVYLPRIAHAWREWGNREEASREAASLCLLLGVLMLVGFVVVAPPFSRILYGAKYFQSLLVFAMVAMLQVTRFVRVWPTSVALALGRSSIELSTNVIRFLGFPMGVAAVYFGLGLNGLVAGLLFGEMLAFVTALYLLNRARKRHLGADFDIILSLLFAFILTAGWVLVRMNTNAIISAVALLGVSVCLSWLIKREIGNIRAVVKHAAALIKFKAWLLTLMPF